MYSVTELQANKDGKLTEAGAILAHASAEKRFLNSDEQRSVDALYSEAERIKATADAIEKNEKLQAELRASGHNVATSDGDRNYEFRQYLTRGVVSPSFVPAPTINDSPFGAFLASPAFSALVADVSGKLDFVRKAGATQMTLDITGDVKIPVESAEETGEAVIPNDASGATDALPGELSIGVNVYSSRVITAPISLARDANGFEDFIGRKMAKRLARAQSRDFTRGDASTGHSEGIMAGCDAIEVDSLDDSPLEKILAAVPEIYKLSGACWSMNDNTLEFYKQTRVWTPPFGGAPGLLLGFPVVVNPDFDWVNETNRVQTLTGAGLVGGTFKLSIDGGVTKTAPIAAGASRHTVQRELEKFVGLGNVEVTGATGAMTVTFHGSVLPTCPEISVDGAALTGGGTVTAAVVSARKKVLAFGDFASGYMIRDFKALGVTRLAERFASVGQIGFIGFRLSGGKVVNKDAIKIVSLP
jgi:HK97 family phage major capsid protein